MHKVICPYCQLTFDRDKQEFVPVGARRYAHPACYEKEQAKLSQEEKEKKSLEEYVINLFGLTEEGLTSKIKKQIGSYIKTNGFTYSGIKKTLIYFYEIKGNSLNKSNGGLGIVPYVYDEANRYYRAIWEANQRSKNANSIQKKEKRINISIPSRTTNRRKLFTFLDEEE